MAIPIPGLAAIGSVGASAPAAPTAGASAAAAPQGAGNFGNTLAQAVDGLQSQLTATNAQSLSVAAGTGNIADYMVSAEQSTLSVQLATTLTEKATGSFNMIMDMSL